MKLKKKEVRFSTFPKIKPPNIVALKSVNIFEKYIDDISTISLEKELKLDEVLAILADELINIGYEIETEKAKEF